MAVFTRLFTARSAGAGPPRVPAAPGDLDNWAGPPRHPDLTVFGPHGADPERVLPPYDGAFGWCARCDVHWRGGAACWNCGGPAA